MFTLDQKQIIVNYHYVEDPDKKFSGIVPCSIKDFEKQVEFLSKNYKIVSVPEVIRAARGGSSEKGCAITFDDGLKDQYQNALPMLEKYRATATFFPITATWNGFVPSAHKAHILLSQISAEKLIDLFNQFIVDFYPDWKERYFIPKNRRLTQRRLHEPVANANFKEMLIMVPEDTKNRFLRYGFKNFRLDEARLAISLFMNEEEVGNLKKLGMTIGNHSHSHYAFDVINEETARAELELSQKLLTELIGERPKIFSYPHGRYNATGMKSVEAAGFDYAVTIERRAPGPDDNQFLIPRYDSGDIKI